MVKEANFERQGLRRHTWGPSSFDHIISRILSRFLESEPTRALSFFVGVSHVKLAFTSWRSYLIMQFFLPDDGREIRRDSFNTDYCVALRFRHISWV